MRLFGVIPRTAAMMIGALLVIACSTTPDRSEGPVSSQATQPPPSAVPSPSTAAFEWAEPPTYQFTVDSRCGERTLIGRFHIVVSDHAVISIEGRNRQGRVVASFIDLNLVPTLADLLERATQARAEGAQEAVVEFGPDGNPSSVRIDPERSTIDDEECYDISNVIVIVNVTLDGAPSG